MAQTAGRVVLYSHGGYPATDLTLSFTCGQMRAPVTFGVNAMLLSASATTIPDIVALAATVGEQWHGEHLRVDRGGRVRGGDVNVGVGASIMATADAGNALLPLAISLCISCPCGRNDRAPVCDLPWARGINCPEAFGPPGPLLVAIDDGLDEEMERALSATGSQESPRAVT